MRIIATSDWHGNLPVIPPCDALVAAGDIFPADDHSLQRQRLWLADFEAWLRSDRCKARHVIVVAGNHDLLFAEQRVELPCKVIYLEDEAQVLDGIRFYGSPWSEELEPGWAFTHKTVDLERKFDAIPDSVDVVITHMPPFGFGDRVLRNVGGVSMHMQRMRTGSVSLRERLEAIKPALAVCGHTHGDRGTWSNGATTFVNASLVDEKYRMVHKPVCVDIDNDESGSARSHMVKVDEPRYDT